MTRMTSRAVAVIKRNLSSKLSTILPIAHPPVRMRSRGSWESLARGDKKGRGSQCYVDGEMFHAQTLKILQCENRPLCLLSQFTGPKLSLVRPCHGPLVRDHRQGLLVSYCCLLSRSTGHLLSGSIGHLLSQAFYLSHTYILELPTNERQDMD